MEKEEDIKSYKMHKFLIIPEVIIILFLFGISIFTILGSKNNGLAADPIFGISLLPVKSDSMIPTFKEGDLVIGKKIKEDTELEVGMIVTYRVKQGSGYYLNTHEIVQIADNGFIYCAGRNPEMWSVNVEYAKTLEVDSEAWKEVQLQNKEFVDPDDILAVYKGRVKGIGNVFTFFTETRANYTIFILVPLLILLLWNIYSFMKVLFESKKEKYLANAMENTELTEELKQKAIQEYLEKQKAEIEAQQATLDNTENANASEEKKEE